MNKKEILENFNIKSFYDSHPPHPIKWSETGWGQTKCHKHDDHKPSAFIDSKTGVFHCKACGYKASVFDYYMDRYNVDFPTAKSELSKLAGLSKEPQRKLVRAYDYLNESGKLIFQCLRYEPKGFSQRRPDPSNQGKWIYNLKDIKLIPYNLPEVIKPENKDIFIVEGEKDVESLQSIGLVASCNPMGAGKWKPEYNQYFKGKKVYILPDNDKPGKDHALHVAKNLKGIAESVKIVELPDIPEKGDVSDWIQTGGNKEKLLEIVKASPEWQPPKEIEVIEDKEPDTDTPTIDLDYNSLPSFLKGLIDLISPTTLAPDEFIVTALLSSMSSAIGTRAYTKFGKRIFNPSIWSMIIAPSSDFFKSTAIREGRNFILKIDKEYEAVYVEKIETYKQDFKKYELLPKEDRLHTTEPMPPIRQEIDFSDDETLESFYQTLHDNTDGGLLAFDEIGGWIEGFDKYRNGNGEKRRWLTIFDNHPIKYKRKSDKTHLNIDKPFVSIIGGITQNTFNKLFKGGVEDIENGFLPRFIFCKTPKLIKKDEGFLKPDIDHDKWEKVYQIFKKVMELKSGAIAPSQEGMEILNDWYKQHQDQKIDPFYPEELSPFWRRLEGYLLKFALIFHQFKRATGEESGNLISIQTIAEAMSLTEYYKGQARAVVRELCQGKEGRVFDENIAILKKLGGEATIRQIQHTKSYWRGRGYYLKEVLEKMEAEGIVSLETVQGRGSQSLRIKLNAKYW